MLETKYLLTMNDEQAGIVQRALEFYARVLLGQFDEIAFETLVLNGERPLPDDFCERRDMMRNLLMQARNCAFPELHGEGDSYGVGYSRVSDIAWNAYAAIRYCRAWNDKPEGGVTVNFNAPLDVSGVGVPKCEVIEDE